MKACETKNAAETPCDGRSLHDDDSAATTLEWALLLGAVALPTGYIIMMGLKILAMQYAIIVRLTSCPFP